MRALAVLQVLLQLSLQSCSSGWGLQHPQLHPSADRGCLGGSWGRDSPARLGLLLLGCSPGQSCCRNETGKGRKGREGKWDELKAQVTPGVLCPTFPGASKAFPSHLFYLISHNSPGAGEAQGLLEVGTGMGSDFLPFTSPPRPLRDAVGCRQCLWDPK